MNKKPEEAFLDGYKPSILTYGRRTFRKYKDELLRYPHIPYINKMGHQCYMIFQDEERKKDYQAKMKLVEEDSYLHHYILGKALGFPERSVRMFAHYCELEKFEQRSEKELYGVAIKWAGFFFESYIDWVDQDIMWLWNTYDHPKAVECNLGIWARDIHPTIEVSYGDIEKVNWAKQHILEKRNLISDVVTKELSFGF